MILYDFLLAANCHFRNVAPVEPDDEKQIHVSLEEFAAVYIKRNSCQQDRNDVVAELRSLGFSEVPVHQAKWAELN